MSSSLPRTVVGAAEGKGGGGTALAEAEATGRRGVAVRAR
jgi:hypothetical protein